ncbi:MULTISPECIES: tryptophan 7-halogenase [unclassified Prochlorococcus]|uniref:tryptophan 7-halogenase n=2 Tax=unclassified Prochlorococcus TaxID=2627481 RepID=UPI00055E769B|nr:MULTISPECIES: tryptophan 7-halogenase [unclassified Prochlorococcus]
MIGTMRIAILGLGTAGAIAARMLKSKFKRSAITVFHTSTIPTTGVGEGGGPWLKQWLDEEGISRELMQRDVKATTKQGILFVDWGQQPKQILHAFTPKGQAHSYHFDAKRLSKILLDGLELDIRNQVVEIVESEKKNKELIHTKESGIEAFDYIIDCRGIPSAHHSDQEENCSPLIASGALLQTCEPLQSVHEDLNNFQTTNAIARPHGWIFLIPLQSRTSIGYIHDSHITNTEAVKQDLKMYLAASNLTPISPTRNIQFKTHISTQFLKNRIYKLGNRAAFIEPLEATAIESTILHCKLITAHIAKRKRNQPTTKEEVEMENNFNRVILNNMERIALFVSWHYSQGSIYDTPYWCKAKANHEILKENRVHPIIARDFDKWIEKGLQRQPRKVPSQGRDNMFFAWSEQSFAAIANILS